MVRIRIDQSFHFRLFDISPSALWTLRWGALVLRIDKARQIFRSDFGLALATATASGAIFLFRGRNYRRAIWGDDELLVDHAIQRITPHGRFHFIDPYGFLDPFSGYLAVLLRISTRVLLLGGTEPFASRAFWFTSFIWTITALCLALSVASVTNRNLGFLAALTIAVMPFSNLVMLAQVNAIHMPAVLAIIVVVVTRRYPTNRSTQIAICVIFALVTLTTITTIIPFGYLFWLVIRQSKRAQPIERRLVLVMGGSLILQLLNYQPRGRHITPSRFVHELKLSSNAFAPQFVREKIFEPKSTLENALLYGIPIILGITVMILARLSRQSQRRVQTDIANVLFLLAALLTCLLIAANGWLNSHYLFIPTGLFWIGVILLCEAAWNSPNRFRLLPIFAVTIIFLSQLSGTYFVI